MLDREEGGIGLFETATPLEPGAEVDVEAESPLDAGEPLTDLEP